MRFLKDGEEILPGVIAMSAPGHTPGHHVFAIHSGADTLVFGGDIAHHHAVFLAHPEVNFSSDMDPQQMVRSRRSIFDWLATDRLKFIGYHFPFPGAGHLVRAGSAYRFVPLTRDTI